MYEDNKTFMYTVEASYQGKQIIDKIVLFKQNV